MTVRIFPVAAPTTVANSFGEPRANGRVHQGDDLFAQIGSPLVAVDDGQLRSGTDPLGGNVLNLYAADGSRYYYAHLDSFAIADGSSAPSPPAPRIVRTGDIVGFLGKTGDAATTQAHLHFEIHPGGGPAVDPFPALAAAPRVPPNQTPGEARARALEPATVVVLGIAAAAAAAMLLDPAGSERMLASVRRRLHLG